MGSASRNGLSLSMIWSQQFFTAIPYMSVETEAAVGLELGTLSVLVSEMWILSIDRSRQWAHTYRIEQCLAILELTFTNSSSESHRNSLDTITMKVSNYILARTLFAAQFKVNVPVQVWIYIHFPCTQTCIILVCNPCPISMPP